MKELDEAPFIIDLQYVLVDFVHAQAEKPYLQLRSRSHCDAVTLLLDRVVISEKGVSR